MVKGMWNEVGGLIDNQWLTYEEAMVIGMWNGELYLHIAVK